eukprot:Hpha_TRINITY_DN1554_c0_g1::TRINITY_DN1554_c0_g1_i1::g.57198::m.57198
MVSSPEASPVTAVLRRLRGHHPVRAPLAAVESDLRMKVRRVGEVGLRDVHDRRVLQGFLRKTTVLVRCVTMRVRMSVRVPRMRVTVRVRVCVSTVCMRTRHCVCPPPSERFSVCFLLCVSAAIKYRNC